MKFLMKGLEVLLAIMVVATVLVVATGVFFRYVLDDPLLYTSELATLLYAYIIFVGLSVALRQDALIGVDVITTRLPEAAQKVCQFIVYIIMFGVAVFMAIYGIKLTLQTGAQLTALQISIKTLYLALPIGFIIFGLNVIAKVIAMFQPGKEIEE
jgi:TRAP-type C4-dicarboxylate transport system permease small subunit